MGYEYTTIIKFIKIRREITLYARYTLKWHLVV